VNTIYRKVQKEKKKVCFKVTTTNKSKDSPGRSQSAITVIITAGMVIMDIVDNMVLNSKAHAASVVMVEASVARADRGAAHVLKVVAPGVEASAATVADLVAMAVQSSLLSSRFYAAPLER
jgi:hypothetical protein